jgi:hypothetical protein
VVGQAFTAPAASAADNGKWSVSPTGSNGVVPRDWFEYELKPGQTIRDLFSIGNQTSAPITFLVYPADAYNTTEDGAFALTNRGVALKDTGSWLQLGADRLTVPAHSRADVPFQLTVPLDASAGDHAAGIVAEDASASPTPVGKGQGVFVRQRVGTRVYVRVAGPLTPAVSVTQLAIRQQSPLFPPFSGSGHAQIAYQVTNTGNVRLTGTAQLKVSGLFGRSLASFRARNIVQLLPKQSVAFVETWNGLPWADHVTATVDVEASGVSTTGSQSFWKIPWLEVLLIVAVVAGGIGWRRRRRRRAAPATPPPPAPTRREPVPV